MPCDFLLAALDGGGHAPPMLDVARALAGRGHAVRVLAQEALREDVAAAGAEFVAWHAAPLARRSDGSPTNVRDDLICGPAAAFAADTRAAIRVRRPDVVASDHMLPGVLIGAEAEGVARVAVAMTFLFVPEWGVPAMGMGLEPGMRLRGAFLRAVNERFWRKGMPAVNAARAANGLPPWRRTLDVIAAHDRVLALTTRALEFPEFAAPPHVVLAGPRLAEPSWTGGWTAPPGDEPLVLVAMSSTPMRQLDALSRAADALGRLPVRGVLTTGPAVDPGDVAAPPNVTVLRAAPHNAVLAEAAAVVTHAGHGTAIKALAAGVPLVCMPFGRDQRDVAARVAARGAGRVVGRDASPERIADAVGAVLADPAHAVGAGRIAAAVAAGMEQDRAVEELEALAARRGRRLVAA